VLYTSGTTSDPKGVLHTSQTLLQEVASMQRAWGLTFRDVMLMASPLTHITGLLQGLLVPCQVGARAVLLDRWDADACVDLAEAEGATYMAGATPFLQGVLDVYDRRASRPSTLRQFCCGGAAVPPALIRRADELGVTAYRCWGMTELPTATLASERDDLERRATTDGRIAEGVEVEAVDGDHKRLAPGQEGELRVRGPERMVGYVDPRLNDDAIDRDGWLYTGDVGTVEDGYVRITGRLKDVINRGGEKLSAREIESVLETHASVSEVAVVPLPDDRLGEIVCAVVVVREDAVLEPDILREHMRAHKLAVQKIPARFEQVDSLPRTASGKIRKHELVDAIDARG
jgi:acyl-CoA synthetase (AMP-forming)/AMP-acid ligase II